MAIVFDYESIGKGLQNRWIPIRRTVITSTGNLCDRNYNGYTCPQSCLKAYFLRRVGHLIAEQCVDFGGKPVTAKKE